MFPVSSDERNANENHRRDVTTHLKYKRVQHMPCRMQRNWVRDTYLVQMCDTEATWGKGMAVSYKIM